MKHHENYGPQGSTYLDIREAARVLPSTLASYLKHARAFCAWCLECGVTPGNTQDWDEMLLPHKTEKHLTRSAFIRIVARVEFFHTRFKGHLQWSHAALDGMAKTVPIKHTAPMGFTF